MMNSTPPGLSHDQLLDLHDEAAQRYVRRQLPGWTAADERSLEKWLAADPLHRSTFDGMGGTWMDAGQLNEHYPQAYGHPQPPDFHAAAAPAARPPARASAWWRRPAFVGALSACLVLLAGGGWYRWEHTPSYQLELSTAPGETRHVDLPDGSVIEVNTASTLRVRYYPRRRESELARGEAFFKVAADAGRPFTVDSGSSRVKVVGTSFNVRAAPPRLVVKVLEGRVEVRAARENATGPLFVLGAGTGIALDPVSGAHQDIRTQATDVGDWRTGQVRFSRAPLAEVADEVARYLGQAVTVDGALLALPVSGFLTTDAPERFLQALPELIAVRVTQKPGGGWHIAAR